MTLILEKLDASLLWNQVVNHVEGCAGLSSSILPPLPSLFLFSSLLPSFPPSPTSFLVPFPFPLLSPHLFLFDTEYCIRGPGQLNIKPHFTSYVLMRI